MSSKSPIVLINVITIDEQKYVQLEEVQRIIASMSKEIEELCAKNDSLESQICQLEYWSIDYENNS